MSTKLYKQYHYMDNFITPDFTPAVWISQTVEMK